MANDEVVKFDTMSDMVLNTTKFQSKERFQFRWDAQTKDIVTTHIIQKYKINNQ